LPGKVHAINANRGVLQLNRVKSVAIRVSRWPANQLEEALGKLLEKPEKRARRFSRGLSFYSGTRLNPNTQTHSH
jgi:hypothetical protein